MKEQLPKFSQDKNKRAGNVEQALKISLLRFRLLSKFVQANLLLRAQILSN